MVKPFCKMPGRFLRVKHIPTLSLVSHTVKRLPTMRETQVQFLGREDPLEKEMATHYSILAWKIPWTEDPGRLQSMGSQRVRHDWVTSLHFTLWSNYSTRMYLPKRKERKESLYLYKDLYTNVHSSFICNSSKLETNQMSINRWMDKQIIMQL